MIEPSRGAALRRFLGHLCKPDLLCPNRSETRCGSVGDIHTQRRAPLTQPTAPCPGSPEQATPIDPTATATPASESKRKFEIATK